MKEARYAMLARTDPERSRSLMALAQAAIDERWRYYEQLAGIARAIPQTNDDLIVGEEDS
jgi:pyruvate-ferredoxin/flavodoxin oxidoreductase